MKIMKNIKEVKNGEQLVFVGKAIFFLNTPLKIVAPTKRDVWILYLFVVVVEFELEMSTMNEWCRIGELNRRK